MGFKSDYLLDKFKISIFLILISFPLVDTVFKITGTNENIENRILSRFPRLTWENKFHIKDDFEAYFRDNFKPRGILFKWYSVFKIEILRVSPSPNVVIGKQNWFFLGDGNASSGFNAMKDYRGALQFKPKELEKIKSKVLSNKKYLDSLGIKYYIVIAPNAQSIYPEYLSNYIIKAKNNSRVDALQQVVRPILGTAFINLIPVLTAYKDSTVEPLYYRTNTHWNSLGAFIGYSFTIRRIKQDFPNIVEVPLDTFKIDRKGIVYGDLTNMIGFEKKYQETDLILVEKNPVSVDIDSVKYPVPKEFYRKHLDYYIRHNSKSSSKLNVLVFRDSFTSYLQQFFPLNFQNSVFIWDMKLDHKIIEKEKPDMVVQIVVERALTELKK